MLKRISARSVVWPPLVVCLLAFLGSSVLPMSQDARLISFGSVAAFTLFVMSVLIVLLTGYVKDQWKMGCERVEAIKSTFLTQEIVNLRLRELALEFTDLCESQIHLQGEEDAEMTLPKLSREIQRAKSAFWGARKLALDMDFIVKKAAREYVLTRYSDEIVTPDP